MGSLLVKNDMWDYVNGIKVKPNDADKAEE